MGVGDFIGIVSVLLGLFIVLVLWIAPFVGLGLAAYYVFRGRAFVAGCLAGRSGRWSSGYRSLSRLDSP